LSEDFLRTWEKTAPNNPQAHLAIGNAYLKQGQTDKALSSFESALAIDGNNVIALNNVAWFQQERGNTNRALELAEDAAQLAPENADVLDTLGWIKFQNDDSSCLTILKKAARLAPASEEIQKHYSEARNKFE